MDQESDQSDSVSGTMPAPEIIAILGRHGCPDITSDIDLFRCSSKPIAGGGFGDIFRGMLQNGSEIAIKCPRLYLDASEENRGVLKVAAREIYAWSKCKHDNVLELWGLAYFHDHIAMVSPWMLHGTLQQYLARRPNADRIDICAQIANGLAYLHSIDFVHGDVKGANVLVSGDGVAKLTDFGNTTLKTHTLQFTGTSGAANFSLRWTAPEVLEGVTGHTRQADAYALGMTILEVVSGKVPFPGRSDLLVFGDIVARRTLPTRPEDAIPTASRYGDYLWELLTLCWAHEPKARPEVLHVLDELRSITQEGLIEIEPLTNRDNSLFSDSSSMVHRPVIPHHLPSLISLKKHSFGILPLNDSADHALTGGHVTASASPTSLYGTPATHFTGSPSYTAGYSTLRSNSRIGSPLASAPIARPLHLSNHKIGSGVYTITNAATGHRAVLRGANSARPLLSVSNEPDAAKEWTIQLVGDGHYTISNRQHSVYASCDSQIKQGGAVFGAHEEKHWHIKAGEENQYGICTTDLDPNTAYLSWGLDDTGNGTSIVLRTGTNGTNNQWRFRLVTT